MCMLSPDPKDDTTFLASGTGTVTLQIDSTAGGSVVFDQTGTIVTDSKGKQVAGTSFPSADIFSFPISKGETYLLQTGYICLPPNATGELREDCTGGIKLADILSTTAGQIFTIKA